MLETLKVTKNISAFISIYHLCSSHKTILTHPSNLTTTTTLYTSSHIWKLLAVHFQGDTRVEHKS